jgi:hypothetical protein
MPSSAINTHAGAADPRFHARGGHSSYRFLVRVKTRGEFCDEQNAQQNH